MRIQWRMLLAVWADDGQGETLAESSLSAVVRP
jgi:hypothetical protein